MAKRKALKPEEDAAALLVPADPAPDGEGFGEKSGPMPGPSTNPATNLLIADLVIRGVTRMTRQTLHKTVLRTGYSPEKAKKLAEDHTVMSTLALYGISKLATRSVPGAVLVGGGLLVKTLYDRGKSRKVTKPARSSQKEALEEEK